MENENRSRPSKTKDGTNSSQKSVFCGYAVLLVSGIEDKETPGSHYSLLPIQRLAPWLRTSSRPSIDLQRDGHTYRLYAWIGAGSSHCDREGSGRRSGRRWWWRWRQSRTSAAADAKQHSERASRKDQPWNVPPGSVVMNNQNHHQNADGPQRPSTDAEIGRGKPQHRPRRQLGPGCGSQRHRRRVARSRVRGESCRSRRR